MAHTDVISKTLIQEIVKDLATYLLGLELRKLEEAPTEQRRIEIRQADIVMHAEDMDGEQFLLHLELQNSNDSTMAQRMQQAKGHPLIRHPSLAALHFSHTHSGKHLNSE